MSDQNQSISGGDSQRAAAAKAGTERSNLEGDVRQQGRQDLRTARQDSVGGRSKDDPSRAPESGTP